jgi:predicted metal-dependent hydrolase
MSAATDIVVRNVRFDWDRSDLHWIRDDPFASHLVNEFSYLLTQGEKFFCRTFREALPLVQDPALRADVEAFIRQEAIHSRAHRDSIEGYLKRLGIEGGAFEDYNAVLFDRGLSRDPFGRKLPRALQRRWLLIRVGLVAAIEHYTAALGTFVLQAQSWERDGADPVVADLFRWHGAEEIEHRSVAYDLYRHLGGRWPLRTLLIGIVLPVLVERMTGGAGQLMRQDPRYRSSDARRAGLRFWRHWRASARRGNTPAPGWFAKHALRFLRPGYHPSGEASTAQALDYLARSPGVRAAA